MAKKKIESKNKNKKVKQQNTKIKEKKYYSEEQQEVIRFVIILVVIVAIVALAYLISSIVRSKNKYYYDEVTPGQINNNIVSVGTMFNRANEEYYVILYKEKDTAAAYYDSVVRTYTAKEGALQVYYCDLSNKLNEKYYAGKDGKVNSEAKTIEDVSFGDFTFVKIKKGKIVKYIEDIEKVKTELDIEES